MTEELLEPPQEVAVSEQAEVEQQDQQEEQKMVPLAALEAERKKRQESEAKAMLYQEYLMRGKEEKEPEKEIDPNALVENKVLQETNASTKRELREEIFQDNNPKAVQEIHKYLKPILEKKPWLADSVDTAPNRYARAYEIVQDYKHLVEEKPPMVKKPGITDGQRIVQNAQKPGSPVDIGKSARPEGAEYLKSIQGKKEFREYRSKVLRGEV